MTGGEEAHVTGVARYHLTIGSNSDLPVSVKGRILVRKQVHGETWGQDKGDPRPRQYTVQEKNDTFFFPQTSSASDQETQASKLDLSPSVSVATSTEQQEVRLYALWVPCGCPVGAPWALESAVQLVARTCLSPSELHQTIS